MKHVNTVTISLLGGLSVFAIATMLGGTGDFNAQPKDRVSGVQSDIVGTPGSPYVTAAQRAVAMANFLDQNPRTDFYIRNDGLIGRVYGKSFAHGETPHHSAASFIQTSAAIFGVTPEELAPIGRFPDGRHVQPVMYDIDTDTYKFTGLYYTQQRNGIPVHGAELVLLMRNDPGSPLVLASSTLKPLGDMQVPAGAATVDRAVAIAANASIRARMGVDAEMTAPKTVIWAGNDDVQLAEPRLAHEIIAEAGAGGDDPAAYQKWMFLTDAVTGQILHEENLVLHTSVSGSVKGIGTTGIGADICGGVHEVPMPYARIVAGANIGYADANGNFSVAAGPGSVNVTSDIRGLYFRVFNQSGSNASISQNVATPGVVNFLHNEGNPSEITRAEVNVYYHSNVVRDYTLAFNPAYPIIANQTEFTVNVNINQNCNAFYNGSSINFYTSGGGCSNTANSTVVYHEYGHHLVNTGGSGQGAYGEGMSDCIAVIITDSPILGQGFQNNCAAGLRNADNNCLYQQPGCSTCGSAIHTCGQLISGCVWQTRNQLLATHPATYRNIISGLTINSILLHTGTAINPSITIDFLTLDDDDDDIFNGTPHYNQINAGFSAHNMPGPEIDPIKFEYPNGLPSIAQPGSVTTFRVKVLPLAHTPVANTGNLHYRIGNEPYTTVSMALVGLNEYEASLPVAECGGSIDFYVSALASNGATISNPRQAPSVFNSVVVATDIFESFVDDFSTDLGWIAGVPDDDATSGHWVRAWPNGTTSGGQQVQPNAPFTGSACYITGQHPGGGAGANDVDNGKTTLVSPLIQLAEGEDAFISYWRWYSNHAGASPFNDVFVIDITNNDGASWVNVETVGPSGPQVQGGWYFHEFRVSSFVQPSDQIRVRFVASDYNPQALIEAAVDLFTVRTIECEEIATCAADLNNSGGVDVQDLLILLGAWGPCSGCVEDLNNSGSVDVQDLLILLGAWGPCSE
ncbi:MAG TPA: hypothetical protein PK400_07905 [Phycisphaerales bacterium]|nr:hypothetical protein [Phycisphaerales bacterium]HRQ76501.1 hypothetical protein [Phycisphaerales bacterium]